MMTWYRKIVSLAAVGLLAAACAEADLPPAGDEGNVEPPAAEDAPQAELTSDSECNKNSDCNIGSICVNVAFGPNYCAVLCQYDALGEHNCPPGFDCTRPFFVNKYRCTPE